MIKSAERSPPSFAGAVNVMVWEVPDKSPPVAVVVIAASPVFDFVNVHGNPNVPVIVASAEEAVLGNSIVRDSTLNVDASCDIVVFSAMFPAVTDI